jgi:hypothetical protein
VLLVPLLVACAENQTQVQTADEIKERSEVQQHRLEVPEDATVLELSLDVETSAGEIAWSISDPTGNLVESGSAAAGARDERTIQLTPVSGTWDLDLELRGATGRYDLRLRATW